MNIAFRGVGLDSSFGIQSRCARWSDPPAQRSEIAAQIRCCVGVILMPIFARPEEKEGSEQFGGGMTREVEDDLFRTRERDFGVEIGKGTGRGSVSSVVWRRRLE